MNKFLSFLKKESNFTTTENGAIAFFGRYDDFYSLISTPAEEAMWVYLKEQLIKDLANYEQGLPVSLLAKWLKSVNASSKETNNLGKLTAKKLGLSEKVYRKTLSKLRYYLDLTEIRMSNNTWTDIIYSRVPSKAMTIYRNAFKMHDEAGFTAYLDSLAKGTATVNAATLYPYDIIERMGLSWGTSGYFSVRNFDQLLEAQWRSLPAFHLSYLILIWKLHSHSF